LDVISLGVLTVGVMSALGAKLRSPEDDEELLE